MSAEVSTAVGFGICEVFTPATLGDALVTRLLTSADVDVLEPSCGAGALLVALRRAGVSPNRIRALDISLAKHPADDYAQCTRGRDFIQWSSLTDEYFDVIVSNPPYIQLNRLPTELSDMVVHSTFKIAGRVPRSSNYWVPFLLRSLSVLRPLGALGFILPASYEYADYAKSIRHELPGYFERFELHRCRRPLFPDVQEGCVVLVGTGHGKPHKSYHRFEYDDLSALCDGLYRCALAQQSAEINMQSSESGVLLGSIADIRIGAVTGDSRFFLLTEDQRIEAGLHESCCVPVVSKAQHLKGPQISDKEWRKLRDEGQRVWMFTPKRLTASARAYIAAGTAGACRLNGYKISSRVEWYRVPYDTGAHGFLSGMSKHGPWITFKSKRNLASTNTLYQIRFKQGHFQHRYLYAMALLTSEVRQQIISRTRTYAHGLRKLEPSDLANLRLPEMRTVRNMASKYNLAVGYLLSGHPAKATAIADTFKS